MPTFDPMQPFTTAEAAAAGITPSQLRGSGFRRLAKGRFVSAARRLDAVLEVERALLGHPPEAFACHLTAGNVYRMPVPHDVVAHVAVSGAWARSCTPRGARGGLCRLG